jgi:hypothetical protein
MLCSKGAPLPQQLRFVASHTRALSAGKNGNGRVCVDIEYLKYYLNAPCA